MAKVKRRTGGQWRTLTGAAPTTTLPDAPIVVDVAAGDGQATVYWHTPDAGGSAITGYTITRYPGGTTTSAAAGATSATIPALVNGNSYTFTVKATNGVGAGPESVASASVTPQAAGTFTYRDATNTGIAGVGLTEGQLTPYTGPTTITTNGTSLYRQLITSSLVIKADNVTLDQCVVRAAKNEAAIYTIAWAKPTGLTRAPTGFTMTDCLIDANGTEGTSYPADPGWTQSACVQPAWGYSLTRCDFRGSADGLKPQDNPAGTSILIDQCYVHGLVQSYGSSGVTHNDCSQIAGSGAHDVILRRSTFDGYRSAFSTDVAKYASSAGCQFGSFPKDGAGNYYAVLQDITIEDSYFNGGLYAWHFDKINTAAVCQSFVVRRNRYGLRFRYGVKAGPNPAVDTGVPQWDNTNTWDATGTTDSGLAVVAGQVIA